MGYTAEDIQDNEHVLADVEEILRVNGEKL